VQVLVEMHSATVKKMCDYSYIDPPVLLSSTLYTADCPASNVESTNLFIF